MRTLVTAEYKLSDSDLVILSVDATNAFNTIESQRLLEAVANHRPAIAGLSTAATVPQHRPDMVNSRSLVELAHKATDAAPYCPLSLSLSAPSSDPSTGAVRTNAESILRR